MRMKKLIVSLIIATSLVSCGPGSNGQFKTQTVTMSTKTTLDQEKPTILKDGGYQIVHGATSTSNMKVTYNTDMKTYALKGQISVKPLNESNTLSLDVDMSGLPDAQGFVYLHSSENAPALPEGVQLGAKATCLGEDQDCTSSFIDIYVIYKEKVYHHQLESEAPPKAKESAESEQTGTSAQPEEPAQNAAPQKPATAVPPQDAVVTAAPAPAKAKPATPAPAKPNVENKNKEPQDDNVEETPESDEDGSAQGRYVGDLAQDINKIIAEDTAKSAAAAPAPKKDSVKAPAPAPAPKTTTAPKTVPAKTDTPKTTPSAPVAPVAPAAPTTPLTPVQVPNSPLLPQSIGPAQTGRLENASNLLDYENSHDPVGFHIISPSRKTYFANRETVAMIIDIGRFTLKNVPNNFVSIGDMSYERGGPIGRHLSHTNGVDSDISFYFSDPHLQGRLQTALKGNGVDPAWMIPEQWALFKHLVDTKTIDRMFIHKTLKMALCNYAEKTGELRKGDTTSEAAETLRRLSINADHYNHFHMRLKCSSDQIRCKQMVDPPVGSGCF